MFYDDAARIELVGSHLLAQIPDDEGRMKDTELDLNDCIGNQNGKLRWGGGHVFHDPSVNCVLRKGDDGPVLHATTATQGGESVESDLPLAERIKNKNGHLVFSDES